MQNLIVDCLRQEVKLATGCTEPVAIALSAAYAASLVPDISKIERIELSVSTNILKNAMNVGVPRTKLVGLEIASALGVYGNPDGGLAILSNLTEQDVLKSHHLFESIDIKLFKYTGTERIYIETTIYDTQSAYKSVIAGRHDQLVEQSVDDKIVFKSNAEVETNSSDYSVIFNKKIVDLLQQVETIEIADIRFMMDGYHANKAVAKYGLENGVGLGLGSSIFSETDQSKSAASLISYAMQMTAAASDARMSGADLPVMTSNGSGNNGLTAVLPIVAADMIFNYEEEDVIRALAMSHLVNSYIKFYLGRLSSVCACGVASATGSAIGIGYLQGLPVVELPHIVDTMVANLSGMICDGAKLGCALKLSTATAAGVQSVYLLKSGRYADTNNGIVGKTPEESVKNLARLANQGMASADEIITEILLEKKSV